MLSPQPDHDVDPSRQPGISTRSGNMPPAGPLDTEPQLTRRQALTMLDAALHDLPLGGFDRRALTQLRAADPAMITAIASLLRRAWENGIRAGRTEQVEELPTVQRLEIERDQARTDLRSALERLDEVYDLIDRDPDGN